MTKPLKMTTTPPSSTNKQRYDRLKLAGLCIACGVAPVEKKPDGTAKIVCPPCDTKRLAAQRAARGVERNRKFRQIREEERGLTQQERRALRIKDGICTVCARKPAEPNRRDCRPCLDAANERSTELYLRRANDVAQGRREKIKQAPGAKPAWAGPVFVDAVKAKEIVSLPYVDSLLRAKDISERIHRRVAQGERRAA